MENFQIILIFFATAVSKTHSLQCYQHYWSEGTVEDGPWVTVTCESGVTSCMSTLHIDSGKTTWSYGCAFENTCHEVAHGTNTSTLIQSCCYSDLCNTNQTNEEFEDDEEYCYSAQCDNEGCLPALIETMHTNKIGAYCKAKDNGCQIMKRKEMLSEGIWRMTEYIGCSHPYPCVGGSTMTDTIHMDRQCCNGHLCTDGNNTAGTDASQDSCYEYYCLSSKKGHCRPPADLSEAVKLGQATLCPRASTGCYYYEGYGINKHHYEYSTGCFTGGILNLDECVPMVTNWGGITAKLQCCHGDRCNTFSAQHNDTEKDKCISTSCVGKDCLETAKQAGNYWLCDKSQYGCEIGVIDTGLDNVFTIGCATSMCEKGSVTSDGLSVLECCNGDRCLPQAFIDDGNNGAMKLALAWTGHLLVAIVTVVTL